MAIVAISDVTAFSIYMGFWFHDVPRWIWVLAIIFFLAAINLLSVKVFGELEFWFPIVKVGAIIVFVFGFHVGGGESVPGLSNLVDHGGFMPNGWVGLLAAFAVVMFAFGGIETIGVTTGEAANPGKSIPAAINADIFGSGRVLLDLAQQGHAPAVFGRISRSGVPWMTVVLRTGVLLVAVVLNATIPEDVFLVIAAIATFATAWVWIMILASHVAMKLEISRKTLAPSDFPVPLWPLASILTAFFMAGVIVLLGIYPDTRVALHVGATWLALLTLAFKLWVRGKGLERTDLLDISSAVHVPDDALSAH